MGSIMDIIPFSRDETDKQRNEIPVTAIWLFHNSGVDMQDPEVQQVLKP